MLTELTNKQAPLKIKYKVNLKVKYIKIYLEHRLKYNAILKLNNSIKPFIKDTK